MSEELNVNPEYPTDLPCRRVLDHGFVALVDAMGDDSAIVQAARVSYGKGTRTVRSDKALISYLMRHRHTTPLEMVELKFIIRLPVFIARQMVRHRTASINEYSARYSEVPDRFWAPSIGAIADQDNVNRQGRADALLELVEALPDPSKPVPCSFVPGETAVLVAPDGSGISRAGLLDPSHRVTFAPTFVPTRDEGRQPDALLPSEAYIWWVERLLDFFPERKVKMQSIRDVYIENNERAFALYQNLLREGVAREIARSVLPLSMYTEWYWKMDLHNLLHFLRLRMDPHAQIEVRCFAEAIATFVEERVPLVWESFARDGLDGVFLCGDEKDVLRPLDDAAQREVLQSLHERGYRRRRLMETCRKLGIDERLVDRIWPPGQSEPSGPSGPSEAPTRPGGDG